MTIKKMIKMIVFFILSYPFIIIISYLIRLINLINFIEFNLNILLIFLLFINLLISFIFIMTILYITIKTKKNTKQIFYLLGGLPFLVGDGSEPIESSPLHVEVTQSEGDTYLDVYENDEIFQKVKFVDEILDVTIVEEDPQLGTIFNISFVDRELNLTDCYFKTAGPQKDLFLVPGVQNDTVVYTFDPDIGEPFDDVNDEGKPLDEFFSSWF